MRTLIVVSAVAHLCLAVGAYAQGGSVAGDRAGLVALYDATDGSNWRFSANWLSGRPLSEWYGVKTDGNGRVTWLHLNQNNLRGMIPAALADLTELRDLALIFNELTGPIPAELGSLAHLWRLDLQRNRLTGRIPPALGNLSSLQMLVLGKNALTGEIPASLATLARMWTLVLSHNDLVGSIPEELGGLPNLAYLSLGQNSLSGVIPSALTNLRSLKGLKLSFNRGLSGSLPSGFVDMDLLVEVDIHGTAVCVPASTRFRGWAATIRLDSSGLACGAEPAEVPIIDVAVFWTPAAREAAGGTSDIEAAIDLMVAETNQAYVDSGVQQRIVLVAREETSYSESESSIVDLRRLANPSDGYLDGVHPIRDVIGADSVHLIVERATVQGVAFLAPRADSAFGLTCRRCGGLTFAHELGHNMGLSHDRFEQCGSGSCTGNPHYPYGFGYVNQRAFQPSARSTARWYTIMAYPNQCTSEGVSCRQVALFSDPGRVRDGDPLGVAGERDAAGLDGPSHAMRALNEARHSVASFRRGVSRDSDHGPITVGGLPDRTLRVGGAAMVDVSGAFRDPDGDGLTYGAVSSVETVATVRVAASLVTIMPVSHGLTTITVTATDEDGSKTTAWQQFAVVVNAANTVDYDRDDDGLIEIRRLAQLDAVRYDANGNGDPVYGHSIYDAAFPARGARMGCPGGSCLGYELIADLDFDTNRSGGPDEGDTYWNDGAGWEPIGSNASTAFAATLEGNGHAIRNLFVHRSGDIGLFGWVGYFAVIRHLGLVDVDVTGEVAGGLAARNQGAIVGSYATGRVVATGALGGGLVAVNIGSIGGSRATATVSGDFWAGGLIGWNFGRVTGSFASGRVSGDAGGLVGTNAGAVVASYAKGRVEGSQIFGGLVARSDPDGSVVASYAAAQVVGSSASTGGLVGRGRDSDVIASYWDTDVSGRTSSAGGSGQTTGALQAPTGYNGLYRSWNRDLDGDGSVDDPWDFGTASQYPALKADINGDGLATWQEFGDQGREDSDGGDDDGDGDEPDDGDGDDPGAGPVAGITVSAECAQGLCRSRTGVSVIFEDASSGGVRSRTWDFGDGRTSQSRRVEHAWSEPGFYDVTLTVSAGGHESTATRTFLVEASDPAGSCIADSYTLCLQDSRFRVGVNWWAAGGQSGTAKVARVGTNDSGLFWFFNPDNWEVLIKVLDGCALNGHVWVFGASTTDLGYSIKVTDTVTGAVSDYGNDPGKRAAAITDGTAFPESCQP